MSIQGGGQGCPSRDQGSLSLLTLTTTSSHISQSSAQGKKLIGVRKVPTSGGDTLARHPLLLSTSREGVTQHSKWKGLSMRFSTCC